MIKETYLTFDDGITPYTLEILDILKKYNIKACFFIVGYRKRLVSNKKLKLALNRIIEEGHILGNHSFSHVDFTTLNEDEIKDEIIKTNKFINDNLYKPYKINFFRPPYGEICNNSQKSIKKYVDNIFLWNLDSTDSNEWVDGEGGGNMKNIIRKKNINDYNCSYIKKCDRILETIEKNNNTTQVILFHDTHNTSVDILEDLIENQIKKGYKFEIPSYPYTHLKKLGLLL